MSSSSRFSKTLIVGFALAAALAAADNPFVGTWKLNPDKSNFTGDTMTFASGGSDEIKFSGGGLSYTFTPDGHERPGLLGENVIWKKIDDRTWEQVHKVKGKVTDTDTFKVSEDGKTLQIDSKGTRPNGETFQTQTIYDRTSGENGLLGGWKSTKVQISSPESWEIKAHGDDGITFYSPAEKFTFSAKFDGKQYPVAGPTVPAGSSGSLQRNGPLSFELVETYKSKPFWKGTFTVSGDKKTLTVAGSMTGVDEPETAVYEKQ